MSADEWKLYITDFVLHLIAENKAKRTVDTYRDGIKNFADWILAPAWPREIPPDLAGDLEASGLPEPCGPMDVTPRHVKVWMAWRTQATSAATTLTNFKGVKSFYIWLGDEEELGQNPMDRIKRPMVPKKLVPIPPDDLVRLVLAECAGKDFISVRDDALIRFIFDTGVRASGASSLRTECVEVERREAVVYEKGRSALRVTFSAKTARALSRYNRLRSRQQYAHLPNFWLGARNQGALGTMGVRLMMYRRGQAVGVRDLIGRQFHPHLGRHWSAHKSKKAGMTDTEMMHKFGWKSTAMVQRYGESKDAELARQRSRELAIGDQL